MSPDDKHLVFTGHDGTLMLLSNKTKQWVASLKMNGSARTVAFTPDSQRMLSAGGVDLCVDFCACACVCVCVCLCVFVCVYTYIYVCLFVKSAFAHPFRTTQAMGRYMCGT